MNTDLHKCAILGKVLNYLEKNPHGADALSAFIDSEPEIMTTEQVMKLTGWSHTYIIRLCKQLIIPYIPGNPHRFLRNPLLQALHAMQVGGPYGCGKTRKRKKKETP